VECVWALVVAAVLLWVKVSLLTRFYCFIAYVFALIVALLCFCLIHFVFFSKLKGCFVIRENVYCSGIRQTS